jgi:inner membrane transporter RhtA
LTQRWRPRRPPALALVGGGICSVQFGSAVASKLFASVGSSGAVLLRLSTASVVLLVLWRPTLRGVPRRSLALAVAFGLVLAGMNTSFYAALARIPLGVAVTFEFVGPLTVALLSSRRPRDVVWVALAVAGILALSNGAGHGLNGGGVAFALLAGVFWGTYILLNARVGRAFTGGNGLALAMPVAAVATLPFGLPAGGAHLLAPRSLGLGFAVGMLSSAIPYSLEVEALRRLPAGVFAVLMSLEPAVAALAGLIVLGQGLAAREVAGIGFVVIASAGASLGARAMPDGGAPAAPEA